jgi:hypothetical protein
MMPETIYYRHVPTGEIRSGTYEGPDASFPGTIWLLRKANGVQIAVHTDNIVRDYEPMGTNDEVWDSQFPAYNPTPLDELPEYQGSRELPVVRICEGCTDPEGAIRACIMRYYDEETKQKEYLNVWYCAPCRETMLGEPVDLEIVLVPDDDLTFGWRVVE